MWCIDIGGKTVITYVYVPITLHVFKNYFKAYCFALFILLIANFLTFPCTLTDDFSGPFFFFDFVSLTDGFIVFFAALDSFQDYFFFFFFFLRNRTLLKLKIS